MIQPGARRITFVVLCCTLVLSTARASPARGARADSSSGGIGDSGDSRDSGETVVLFAPEELMMSIRETEVFRALRHPKARERFLARFWSERADQVRANWDKRLPLATKEFSDPASDRARLFLTAGPPLYRVADVCPAPVTPHEIWYYSEDGTQTIVFVAKDSGGNFEIWRQGDWRSLLGQTEDEASQRELLSICPRGQELAAALAGSDYPRLLPGQAAKNPNWVEDFLAETTLLPPDARPLEATVNLDYPAAVGDRTAVVVTLEVPQTATYSSELRDFSVTGEVFGTEAVDDFRFQFSATADARDGQGELIRLTARRHLPPGKYSMVLKLHDVADDRYLRTILELDVPALDHQEAGWAEPGQRLFKLMPPPEGYLTGSHRFDTINNNPDVAKVKFFLDGELGLTKNRSPFSVELDLGVVPRPREIEAVAFNGSGYEIARDRMTVNSGPHRFAIRLVEPRRGAQTDRTTKVHAVVETPLGERLSHVDFFWNETCVAQLYQPPFVQTLRPLPSDGSSYLRAVAVLDDGHSAEDLVVVNTGDTIEAIEVDFVELYASVLGREGTAIEGLEREEFRVFEDDVEQELRRFETVDHLPVSAVVVLDSSTSMTEEIREVEEAAAKFFERVVEPKDRAAVIVFNDTPLLRVPLTNDTILLNNGLAGVEADGETSLYDSLIYGLYYLAGLRGKRALILVSDGADSASEFSFEDALDFAKRSGVAIYTIGLGLANSDVAEHAVLRKLARATGGDSFFVESARRLDRIYDRIEQDLRSQYLLGYQSPQLESRAYREVRVEVTRKGLEVKTVPGYYP